MQPAGYYSSQIHHLGDQAAVIPTVTYPYTQPHTVHITSLPFLGNFSSYQQMDSNRAYGQSPGGVSTPHSTSLPC